MPIATTAALVFTVAWLVTTAYFLMGGLPLLVLQHDTPLDGRFVHGFFALYFRAAVATAAGTALSYAAMGRPGFALGAAGLLLLALGLRRLVLPRLEALRLHIQGAAHGQAAGLAMRSAVARFRRLHGALLLNNALQLALAVWSLTRLKL